MVKLTEAQREALEAIASINDKGSTAHVDALAYNRGVLDRLRKRELIHSEAPFAWAYHRVTITEAGRTAIARATGETP